jgi:chromosome segregation ATPase
LDAVSDELRTTSSSLSSAEAGLRAETSRVEALSAEVSTVHATLSVLEVDHARVVEQAAALRQHREEDAAEVERLEKELRAKRSELTVAHEEHEAQRKELLEQQEAAELALAERDAPLTTLQEQLAAANAEREGLQSAVATAEQDVRVVSAQLVDTDLRSERAASSLLVFLELRREDLQRIPRFLHSVIDNTGRSEPHWTRVPFTNELSSTA